VSRWPYYTGPDDQDRCGGGWNTGHGCGHPKYDHRRGVGRCMEGVGLTREGWRCDCTQFEPPEPEEPEV
jgi:hypothetical protein